MEESRASKQHAIIFPYPYQGHITPAAILAVDLAARGFAVTYVQLEFFSRQCGDPFVGSGLDVHCATISDGFPAEYDRGLNFAEYWEGMLKDFPTRADKLIESITTSSSSNGDGDQFFLVADTLYTWTADIAEKHNLVHVSLWTEAATVFSIDYHLELLREYCHHPYTDNGKDNLVDYIPGVEPIRVKDLMSHIQHPEYIPLVNTIVIKAFDQVKRADFILCNTVQEVEPEAILALSQKQPTYAIGPINFSPNIPKHLIHKMSMLPQSNCISWLDSKLPSSVLYISFGSNAQMNKHEIREVAHGLLVSGVNFLWILRIADHDAFPDGFREDVKDRGLVVPWCDQSRVLSNPSIGGFLTHCGWNSVLESMWNGVPMICYPFIVDQPTNRKLVVDDWKNGINLCDGGQVGRDEVVSTIDTLMGGNMSVGLKERAKNMKEKLRNALKQDGSSCRNFDKFIEHLKVRLDART